MISNPCDESYGSGAAHDFNEAFNGSVRRRGNMATLLPPITTQEADLSPMTAWSFH